jgi:hypothetical protein
MRLLNTTTGHIRSFLSAPTVPYAILSHTWGPEEVTLQDMLDIDLRFGLLGYEQIVKPRFGLLGYEKIVKSCEIARRDEYEYIWIDTCCIDKTNSAELSEALNSMFRWYVDIEGQATSHSEQFHETFLSHERICLTVLATLSFKAITDSPFT